MQRTDILRTTMSVTRRCTLRCKLCLNFVPYHEHPTDMTFEEAKRNLESYFKIVDTVKIFTITGGEPLMNKDLCKIFEEVYKYKNQIVDSVNFVTNGTLNIPDDLLSLFEKHAAYTKVVISDYGELSPKVNDIVAKLEERNINYRVSKFHGDNLYYEGWIDFTDHTKKIDDIQERDELGEKCIFCTGKYFIIHENILYTCSRSYWRMAQGYIPMVEGEYVDLTDETIPLEKKRKDLLNMFALKSSTSCAHCVGMRNDVKRHYPAEQLPRKK